jgi:hypothetical protein
MEFKTNTPVLPDVKLLEVWAEYDGPLFGICEINNQKLFFMDIISDIWRYYEDDSHQRLWAIFGVYDISREGADKIITSSQYREKWANEIEEESNCIGVFWEYEQN